MTIADQQLSQAAEELSERALQQVNTIFSTQLASFDVVTAVPIQQNTLHVTCEALVIEDEVQLLSQLEISGLSRTLENELVASRQQITTDHLLLFSKEWKAPFSAANILLATTQDELLITQPLDKGIPTSLEELNNAIPAQLAHEQLTASSNLRVDEVRALGEREATRIVFVSRQPLTDELHEDLQSHVEQLPGEVYATYLEFSSQAPITEQGTLHFLEADTYHSYSYVGEAMLFGLIYQATPQRANCLQHKLQRALNRQATLHEKRVDILAHTHPSSVCSGQYIPAPLQRLQGAVMRNEDYNPPSNHVLYDFSTLAERASDVEQINNGLSRGERCATIY